MLKFCVQMGYGQVYKMSENQRNRLEDASGINFSVQTARGPKELIVDDYEQHHKI